MSIIEILLDGNTLFTIFVFVIISIVVEIIGTKVVIFFEDVPVSQWIFERTIIPLARAATIMLFILLCYPVLFGIQEAPALMELLTTGSQRISTLLNILFIVPLLFSLIPVIGKVPAFVLPVQTIAGSTLMFSWMQAALNVEYIRYMPQLYIFLIIVLFAIMSHLLAHWAADNLAKRVNRFINLIDGEKIVYRTVVVVAQLPVVLIYTTALGAQL